MTTDQTRRSGPDQQTRTAPCTSIPTDFNSMPRPSDSALPSGVSRWWWSCAVHGVEQAARTGMPFDVGILPEFGVPPADHPNHWGVLVAACAAHGVIESTGKAVIVVRGDGRVLPARQWRGTAKFRRRMRTREAP